MGYTEAQAQAFINYIAPIIVTEGQKRGYKVFSTIIAQAIIEGACGTSTLAKTWHNHFGMKCGSSWKGRSVNLKTKEEYKPGQLTDIKANFRAYDNDVDGVKGYYDFIGKPRYENLKNATNYKQYAKLIKADGYATSSRYVKTLTDTVDKYGLQKYDPAVIRVTLLAQASKGETGFVNQKPGNQTGRELNIVKYYTHVKGWRVFRAPTATAQNRIAYAALRAVDNTCIGYDQSNRNTLFEAAQKYGYDPGSVHVDVECDCSSLVRVCVAYAGIVTQDFNTASEPSVLLQHGFTEVGLADLQVGDILCTKSKGHTCIVVQI